MEGTADRAHTVRVYIDTDITPKLAQAIRARGYDAIAAREVGNTALQDDEHMAFAAAAGRALLTCNDRDFTPLFEQYWFAGREHSGVIVSAQVEFGEMLRRILALLAALTAVDMQNNWKNLAEFAAT